VNLPELRVRVVPGSGVVVNHGAALMLAFATGDAQEKLLDEILALVEEVISEDPDTPGRRLARKIVGVVSAAEPDDVPSFGLLAVGERGLAVLLQGDVDVELGRGGERLSGRDVSTWLDRIVDADVDELSMFGSDRAGTADPRSDLRAGTVAADGVVLAPRGLAVAVGPARPRASARKAPIRAAKAAAAPSAEATVDEPTTVEPMPIAPPPLDEEAETPPAQFVSVSLSEPLPAEELQPLPVARPNGSAGPEPAESGVEVHGILCSRQHFNDPNARFCSSCGISMVHQTHNLVTGVRPPLGILVLDDGAAFVLDGDFVIGREPDGHPDVRAGAARPLTVTDQDATTSRAHARIHIEGWNVQIIDLGSANGSYVAAPGDTEWTRVDPNTPISIGPGARVHIGGRNFVFESHHKA